MKPTLIIVVLLGVTALSSPFAYAQSERLSDSRFIAASRCVAYADITQLQSDAPDVAALREVLEDQDNGRNDTVVARARSEASAIRRAGARARRASALAELRTERAEACGGFVSSGLVQMSTACSAS